MKSFAKQFGRGLVVCVWFATQGAPAARAQMLDDSGLRSALTSSLLQTTQQKHRRRISKDPYLALIEQSDPDRRLRELTSTVDPLSPAARTTPSRIELAGQMAHAGGVGALGSALSMQSNALMRQSGLGKAGSATLLPSMVPGMGAASLSAASILSTSGAAYSMSLQGAVAGLAGSGLGR